MKTPDIQKLKIYARQVAQTTNTPLMNLRLMQVRFFDAPASKQSASNNTGSIAAIRLGHHERKGPPEPVLDSMDFAEHLKEYVSFGLN